MSNFDLVVRGGTVVDGSGAPRYRADVGVQAGRIVSIGRIRDRGAEEIDAEGQFVTPGFIDGHTHLDAQVNWDPLGTSVCWHGVTSVIMGNCGFTIAPCRDGERDLVLRSLERAEDISRKAMLAGIRWEWETFSQYLDVVDRLPKGINYSAYIGHSALRTYVMGERAFEEVATASDLEAMQTELSAALQAGAVGFSTSRSSQHATSDDKPVASRLASWDEVCALVGTMGDLGVGLFELTNETHPPGEGRVDYFKRIRSLAVDSGRPTLFMLNMMPTEPDLWKERLAFIDESSLAGGRMYAQVHTREFQIILSFQTSLPFDKLPLWSAFRRRPLAEQRHGLSDPAIRGALVTEAMTSRFAPGIGAESRPPDYEHMYLLDAPMAPYRSVAAVAREQGITPVDLMIDLALASDFNQLFSQVILNFDQDAVLSVLRHPRTIVGASDSGAHVSQIMDSSLPTHLLAHWVHERQAFEWEEGIRMLTGLPATIYGFGDRGLLREGFAADLVVFDPKTIGPSLPTVAQDLPAGATRLKQMSQGIHATVVNGRAVWRDGVHSGSLPGRLLRGPLAHR